MPLIVSKKANLKTETSGGQQNNSDFKGNLYTFDNTKQLDLVNDTTNVPETYWKKQIADGNLVINENPGCFNTSEEGWLELNLKNEV